jgi:hypothetical protein
LLLRFCLLLHRFELEYFLPGSPLRPAAAHAAEAPEIFSFLLAPLLPPSPSIRARTFSAGIAASTPSLDDENAAHQSSRNNPRNPNAIFRCGRSHSPSVYCLWSLEAHFGVAQVQGHDGPFSHTPALGEIRGHSSLRHSTCSSTRHGACRSSPSSWPQSPSCGARHRSVSLTVHYGRSPHTRGRYQIQEPPSLKYSF